MAMIGYGIALLPLAEQLRQEEKEALVPFYAGDLSLDGPARLNARLLKVMMERGLDRGYFPKPEKLIHICDNPADLEATRVVFAAEDLKLKYHGGYRYVGGFVGSKEEELAWVKPQVEAWAEGVRILAGFAHKYLQIAYAGLAMSLRHEWQYLQQT
eukprot:12687061-Ditylum_brightwellii.AAC.1